MSPRSIVTLCNKKSSIWNFLKECFSEFPWMKQMLILHWIRVSIGNRDSRPLLFSITTDVKISSVIIETGEWFMNCNTDSCFLSLFIRPFTPSLSGLPPWVQTGPWLFIKRMTIQREITLPYKRTVLKISKTV